MDILLAMALVGNTWVFIGTQRQIKTLLVWGINEDYLRRSGVKWTSFFCGFPHSI